MAPAILPNTHKRVFAGRFLGQLHGRVRIFYRMAINFFYHIAWFQSGFSRRRAGFNLGHNRAFYLVWHMELLAGRLIEIADIHAVQRAGVRVV